MHRIWYLGLVAGILTFIPGCFLGTTTKKTVSTDIAVQPESLADDEGVSPSTVKYTFLDTINRHNELLLADADFGKSDQKDVSNGVSVTSVSETRYRVQVLASNRIETAREQKKELEKKISEQVVIGYEAPYYKLYAGSFIKRQEAQAVLMKLKKLGFLDAWIVATSVIPEN